MKDEKEMIENKQMICIILPAYNEEKSIDSLFIKIEQTMKENNYDYKIILVNDGSADNTSKLIAEYSKRMPIEIITHKLNRGLWETIRDGFERAAEICTPDDIIVRMDCDDTHEPKYISEMVEKIRQGYEVVIASRFQPGGGTRGLDAYRNFVSRMANLLMKMFFPIKGIWEYSCGYRAYRAELIQDALHIFGNDFIDLRGLGFTCTLEKLFKFRMMKARITEIPFVLRYDQKESPSKMITSITTLGYLILIIKYIYPWGDIAKGWLREIKELNKNRKLRGGK
jgi:dolichol-phosphate mannosyltransferase